MFSKLPASGFARRSVLSISLWSSPAPSIPVRAPSRPFSAGRPFYADPKDTKEAKEDDVPIDEREPMDTEQKPVDMRDKKIEELEELVNTLKSNWRLALSDAENIRKIAQRDVDRAREFGAEKLVKALFGVTDTLEICIKNKPADDDPTYINNTTAKNAFQAMDAVYTQIQGVFKDQFDLDRLTPKVGDPFDPNEHNALFEVDPVVVDGKKVEGGRVGLVFKSGWKRGNKLMRAADVGVVRMEQ